MNKVPTLLIITHMEQEKTPQKWWDNNKDHFYHYGIKPTDYACVTCTRGLHNRYSEEYDRSAKDVRRLLSKTCEVPAHVEKGVWFVRVAKFLFKLSRPSPNKRNLRKALQESMNLTKEDADRIAQSIENTE